MGKARQLPCYHTGRGFLWSLARLRSAVRQKSCYLPEVFNRGRRGRQSYKTLPTTSGNDQYSGKTGRSFMQPLKNHNMCGPSVSQRKKKPASVLLNGVLTPVRMWLDTFAPINLSKGSPDLLGYCVEMFEKENTKCLNIIIINLWRNKGKSVQMAVR